MPSTRTPDLDETDAAVIEPNSDVAASNPNPYHKGSGSMRLHDPIAREPNSAYNVPKWTRTELLWMGGCSNV